MDFSGDLLFLDTFFNDDVSEIKRKIYNNLYKRKEFSLNIDSVYRILNYYECPKNKYSIKLAVRYLIIQQNAIKSGSDYCNLYNTRLDNIRSKFYELKENFKMEEMLRKEKEKQQHFMECAKEVRFEKESKHSRTKIIIVTNSGEEKVASSFYDDELSVSEYECIGRTAKEISDMVTAKDIAYLRS